MSGISYVTKAGGFWLLNRVDPSDTTRDALDALPGGVLIAFLSVRLLNGGPPEWGAALVVVAIVRQTDSVLLAMASGVGVVVILRGGIGTLA
uniref:AzlD domain-containing protein n=2 Tax=Natrinema halophilum TaxID=1699371 RepID=A0A7D5KU33_9EURY